MIELNHRHFFNARYGEQVLQRARRYLEVQRVKAESVMDVHGFGRELWERVAIPGFLYGVEATPLKVETVTALERLNCKMAKAALQLSPMTQNAVAYVLGGFKPIWYHVYLRMLTFITKLEAGNAAPCTLAVWKGMDWANTGNPYVKRVRELVTDLGLQSWEPEEWGPKLERARERWVEGEGGRVQVSMFLFPPGQGAGWVKRVGGELGRVYHEFLVCHAGLGNRGPLKNGAEFKDCPLCEEQGYGERPINEMHVILTCPALKEERKWAGVDKRVEWAMSQPGGSRDRYAWFWGKEGRLEYRRLLELCRGVARLRELYWEKVLEGTAGWAVGRAV